MPFDGNGNFTNPFNWVNEANNGFNITASKFDTQDGGIATGLSLCLTKDGQQTWTANQNTGVHKLTNMANGSATTDSVALGQVMLLTGTQTMTGKLSLVAGTTTVAPMGFASGTNLTTPVSGVMEYDGTHLYFTDNVPTRHTIAPQDSPVFTTPTLGAATATTINKVTLTAPAAAATLTIANNKTLTVNNSLTFAGTDATTQTFQASDTIVGLSTTDTLSNKSISGASNTLSAIALSSLANQAGNTFVANNTGGSAAPIAITKAQALAVLGISTYTSADQSMTAGSTIALTHSLGIAPAQQFVNYHLVNQTAEGGYNIGDLVELVSTQTGDAGSANRGIQSKKTTNVITIMVGANNITILRGDTGADFVITLANWKLRVGIWAYQ